MTEQTIAAVISSHRKELGMTQKELAEKLNITDKAVSKWERGIACPDIGTLPKLAQIFGISLDELMNATPADASGHRGAKYLAALILKAVPLAMGIAVTVIAALGELNTISGFSMLGIGVACLGIRQLHSEK